MLTKRSKIAAHRHNATDTLMALLAQKITLREAGLDEEDPEISDVVYAEI